MVSASRRKQRVSHPDASGAMTSSYTQTNPSCKLVQSIQRAGKLKMHTHAKCTLPAIEAAAEAIEISETSEMGQEVEHRRDDMQLPKRRKRPETLNRKTLEKLIVCSDTLHNMSEQEAGSSYIGNKPEKKRGRPSVSRNRKTLAKQAVNYDTLPTVSGQEAVSSSIGNKPEKKKRGRRPGVLNRKTLEKLGVLSTTLPAVSGQEADSSSIGNKPEKKRRGRRPGVLNRKTLEKLGVLSNTLPTVSGQEAGSSSSIGNKSEKKKRGRPLGVLNRKTLEKLRVLSATLPTLSGQEAGSSSSIRNKPEKKRERPPGTENRKAQEKLGVLSPTLPTVSGQNAGSARFGKQPEKKPRGKKPGTVNSKSIEKCKVMKSVSDTVLTRARKQQWGACLSDGSKEPEKSKTSRKSVRVPRKTWCKCEMLERTNEQYAADDELPTGRNEQEQVQDCSNDSEAPEEKRGRTRRSNTRTAMKMRAVCKTGTRSICPYPCVTHREIPNAGHTQVRMSVFAPISTVKDKQMSTKRKKKQNGMKTCSSKACYSLGLPNPVVTLLNCDSAPKRQTSAKEISNLEQLVSLGNTAATQNTKVSALRNKGLEISANQKRQNQSKRLIRGKIDSEKRPRKRTLHCSVTDSSVSSSNKSENATAEENKELQCNVQRAGNEESLCNSVLQEELNNNTSMSVDKSLQPNTFEGHVSSFCGNWRTPSYLVSEEEYSDDSLSVRLSPFASMSPHLTPYSQLPEIRTRSISCQRVVPFTGQNVWKCSCARTSIWTFSHKRPNENKNTNIEADEQSLHWKAENNNENLCKKRKLDLLEGLSPLDFNPSVPDLEGFISSSCSDLIDDVPLNRREANEKISEPSLYESKKSVEIKKDDQNNYIAFTPSKMFTVPKQSQIIKIKPPSFRLPLTYGVEKQMDFNCSSLLNVKETSDMSYQSSPPVLDFFGKILQSQTHSSPLFCPISTDNISDSEFDIRDQTDTIYLSVNDSTYHPENGASSTSNFDGLFLSKEFALQCADANDSYSELQPSPENKLALNDASPYTLNGGTLDALNNTALVAPGDVTLNALNDSIPCALGDSAPAALGDSAPAALGDSAPAALGDSAPAALGDSAPAALGDSAPAALGDSAPAALGDSAPAALGDSAPAALGDSAPAALGDSAPAALGDSAPAALGVSAPAALGVSAPAALGVSAPAALGVSAPAALGVSAPAALGVSAPAALGVSAPAALGVSVPAALGDSVPAALGDSAPAALGDSAPAALGDSAPAALGDSAPAALGDSAPAALGVSAPAALGVSAPAALGVSAPAALGVSAPAALGVSAPAALGVSAPAALGGSSPKALGGSSPKALGGSSPKALGDSAPAALGDSAPAALGDSAPAALGDSAPAALGDSAPAALGVSAPAALGVSAPAALGVSAPAALGVSAPAALGVSAPAALGDSAPAALGDSAPAALGDSAPAALGDSAPAALGDSAPAALGDSAPAALGDSAPAALGDSAPAALGGSAPAALGGSAPKALGGSAPKALGGSSPKALGGSSPKALGDSAPKALGDSAPAALGDSAPAALGDSAPAALGDSAPAALGDSAPAALGDSAPAALGVSAPAALGVSAPAALGVSAPAALGDSAPAALGDSAPAALGDSAPAALGDSAPAALGDSAPKALGGSAPKALGGSSPKALADPAPKSLADPAPKSLADPAPKSLADPAPHGLGNSTNVTYEDDVLVIDVIPNDPDLFGCFSEERKSPEFCSLIEKKSTADLKPKNLPLMPDIQQEAVSPEPDRSDSPMEMCTPVLDVQNQNVSGNKQDWTHALNLLSDGPNRPEHLTEWEDHDHSELPNQDSSEWINLAEKFGGDERSPPSQEFLPNNRIHRPPHPYICLQTESSLNENCHPCMHDFHGKEVTLPGLMNPDRENWRYENKLNCKPLQQIRLPYGYCKYFFNSPNGCYRAQCSYLHIPKQNDEQLCMDLMRKMINENRTSFLQRAFLVFIEYFSKYPPRKDYDEGVFSALLDQLLKLSWLQEVLHLLNTATSANILPSVENLIQVFEHVASSRVQVAVPSLMGIFNKCLNAGMTPTLLEINHIIATVNQLPDPRVPINFLLSVKSKIEAHLPKKSWVHELEAAMSEIEDCKVNSDWVKLGALYVSTCTGCENLTDLKNFSQCIAEVLMKESIDDRPDVPYCEFVNTIFKHPQLNDVHKTIVGRIGISAMFFYYKKELWQKGRRVLFKFNELKINYRALKGIAGQEVFASQCAVVNVAVEIFLMCGKLNSAVQTLRECDWIIQSAMWPCDQMDVLKRHSLLCSIVQEALRTSMFSMCFEVLQNLPGFKESQAEFNVSQYNVIFNKVLNSAVSNQSLGISSSIVDFMVLKKIPIDYINLRDLITALGHSGLWHKARDQYKCALSLGFYPLLDGDTNNTILYIPSFMSAIEMLLTIERFMVSKSSTIRLPGGCFQNLQIILRKIFKDEDSSKGKDSYHVASERLLEAARLSSPRLFIKHLTVNNSGEQVYILDHNCCVKWLSENVNWAVKIWGFH
ncbi:LOW QUALITY PROTEIN: protein TOPAZ1 [Mantella aurantiaca]